MACAAELAGCTPAEGFEGFAEFGVLQDDEAPALSADGAGGEAGGFEDVVDVVVADFLLGVEEFDGAAAVGGVEDELLDVLVLHGLYLSLWSWWMLTRQQEGEGVYSGGGEPVMHCRYLG